MAGSLASLGGREIGRQAIAKLSITTWQRNIPLSMAISGVNRSVPIRIAISGVYRSIPVTQAISGVLRTVPMVAASQQTGIRRTVPTTAGVSRTNSRSIPTTVGVKKTNVRGVPMKAQVIPPQPQKAARSVGLTYTTSMPSYHGLLVSMNGNYILPNRSATHTPPLSGTWARGEICRFLFPGLPTSDLSKLQAVNGTSGTLSIYNGTRWVKPKGRFSFNSVSRVLTFTLTSDARVHKSPFSLADYN